MFGNLVQPINFIGVDCSWELRDFERAGNHGEFDVFGLFMDHANVSVITTTIGSSDGSKHCSKFACELVNVFIGWLAIKFGDFKFLKAFFYVLFNSQLL